MSAFEEHYRLLGLRPGCSEEELKTAFRSRIKVYHPDIATSQNLAAIARSGKLISADAFRFGTERRWGIWPFRTAFCSGVYQLGVNIAISNVPGHCAAQRDDAAKLLSITLTR